ncbi:MAG TPA: hypothetical protein VH592_07245 [Gemmataceae bacterium]|jgi:hypothetical protein
MGNAGPAILFMISFAASIIVGTFVVAYAARCVLVVVQETAQGQDKIIWPNEPYVDGLGHAVLFLELVGIWLAPAALTARLLRHVWLPNEAALRVLLLAGPGLWLFFPIGLMSSLSAQSRWVPFRWVILHSFLRVAPAALVFYFQSALLLVVGVVPWYYALFGGMNVLLPVAAVVSAAVLFIYSRLLGRLACIIQRLPALRRAPAKAKVVKRPQPRRKKKQRPDPKAQDPWIVPEEEERERKMSERFPWAQKPPPKPKSGLHIPSAEEIEGYGFAEEKPAAPEPPPEKPVRSRFAQLPEEYEPYDVRGTTEPPAPTPSKQEDAVFAQQVRQHIAERTRAELVLPAHPFISGIYTFPLYSACLPNCLALAFCFMAEGGLVALMISFGSALFHW